MSINSFNTQSVVASRTITKPNTVKNILTVLFKRKLIIVSVFTITAATVAIFTLSTKPVYLAKSKIMVEKEMESEKSLLFRMNLNLSLEQHDFIKSEMEIISSIPVALQIINKMNLGQIELNGIDPANVNLILSSFQSRLSVENMEDTNVLDIGYESGDPHIAAAVVNELVKEYLAFRAQLFNESEEYNFFDEQIRVAEEKLRELEEHQTQFKKANGMLSPDVQNDILLGKIADYERALTDVRTRRIGKEAMLQVINMEISSGDKVNIPVTESSNASSREKYIAKLRGDMLDLQLRRDLLLQNFTPEYEEVVKLDQAIASTQERIEREIDEIVSLETTAIRALKAEEEALQSTINGLNYQMKAFAQKEYDLTLLSRDIEHNQDVYSMLLKQREEARISQAKLSRGIKIKVISLALVPSKPIRPKKRRNILLGIFLGAVSGLGLAFLIEYFDHSLNSPEQVEERLSLPVWGAIKTVETKLLSDN